VIEIYINNIRCEKERRRFWGAHYETAQHDFVDNVPPGKTGITAIA
jgi:hypothetical protein